jgi:hypothetical protein
MPRSPEAGAYRNGPNPDARPSTLHQGPWASPSWVARWEAWRANRCLLDARTPREYVIDGRTIHDDQDFGFAIQQALMGPLIAVRSERERRLDIDGFGDWLNAVWSSRAGDAVLVWKHHEQCRDIQPADGRHHEKPVFDVLLEMFDDWDVPYRLD